MNSTKNGFTLIEMIIVITIIAVLATGSLATFRTVALNSRDQQRIRDLQSIKQALELYRNDLHFYPADTAFNPNSASQLSYNSKIYLVLPSDPSGQSSGQKYGYRALPPSCDNTVSYCTSYVLCSAKEGNVSYGQGSVKVWDCSSLLPAGANAVQCGSKACQMGIQSD